MKMINSQTVKDIILNIDDNQFRQYCILDDGEVLIGKNSSQCCFVVRGQTKKLLFKSSAVVKLELELLDDKKQLLFTLLDNSFIDVFIKLLEDICQTLETAKGNCIDISYKRWIVWKTLFSLDKRDILPDGKILGLVGELYMLVHFLADKFTITEAVKSWGGANYNKKDFEISSTWFEVKSTIKQPAEVEITSIDQLNSNKDGYLVIFNMNKSTQASDDAVNLNELVNECLDKIADLSIAELFMQKMSEQGYVYNIAYDQYNYEIMKTSFYLVSNDFPRLTPHNIPFGIGKCKYTLIQDYLDKYLVKAEDIS